MRSSPSLPAAVTALTLAFIFAASIAPAGAQSTGTSPFPIPYVLLPDSRYEEGCFAPCMCPILLQDGTKGGFTLSFSGFQPPFIVYDVQDINWTVPVLGKNFTGSGRYLIGWKGTAQQQLQATLSENGAPPEKFDSGLVPLTAPFPFIDIAVSLHGFYCYDKAFYLRSTPARPVTLSLRVDPSDLFWDLFPDSPGFDAVFGSVSVLRGTGGDFTAATSGCLGSNVAASPVGGAPDPPLGEAFWYLVRAHGGVAGTTYDAGDPGKDGTCDAEIDAAPAACP
jgi:hypothetical protein